MAQSEQADHDQTNPKKSRAARLFRYTKIVAACGTLLLLLIEGLIIFSHRLDARLSDPVQFVTGNLLNALIFIAIVAQVFVYRKQWKVMERQWRATKKQLRLMALSECAYIAVDAFEPPLIGNDTITVQGKFFNRGETPAFNVERKIQIATGSGHPPKGWGRFDWDANPFDTEPVLLLAHSDVNFGMTLENIPADEIAQVKAGELLIALDGECRYGDISGDRQIYTFGVTFELNPLRPFIRYQNYRREEEN